MFGKRKFKRVCSSKLSYVLISILTIYYLRIPPPHPSPTFSNCWPTLLYSEFQGIPEGFVSRDSIQFLTTC